MDMHSKNEEEQVLEFLEQVKYQTTANMGKDPRYMVRFASQLDTYLKEKPLGSISNANYATHKVVDTEIAVVNTADIAAIAVEIVKNPLTVKEIKFVFIPVIKVETPDFLLSSSPGPDVERMRLQFNEMYDQAYITIDPIDQSVKISFFNREIIEELGVIGNPIPDFSDGMDEDLPK
ncbi:hypothetical protein BB560_003510 [Smittium megazygosporum]|uniref:Uncharacterized protein n=1 Tax=Smittium megazygosporum TaxID=133381 RepID=A0A2T9ZBT6_9FUNG|nr:hypothetical protein BB560_003510 [Smittium megazygosporum]